MRPAHRDLTAPELWERSLARSRLRRALAPRARREHKRRKGLSAAAAAATMAGPGAPMAMAQFAGGGDPDTAVRQSQTRAGLQGDGMVGPATWGALFESGPAVGGSNVSPQVQER